MKRRFLLTRLVNQKFFYLLKSTRTVIEFSIDCVLEKIPVEIWSKMVSYLNLKNVFQFSNFSKFFFVVAQLNKLFLKKNLVEAYFAYDLDRFDFINRNFIHLSKNIEERRTHLFNINEF